jgi:hypothetical protein
MTAASYVERVLHAGVHAMAARGTVNVGRIAREEHAAVPVRGHLAVMNLETRQPVAVGDRDATDPLIEKPLQMSWVGCRLSGPGRRAWAS